MIDATQASAILARVPEMREREKAATKGPWHPDFETCKVRAKGCCIAECELSFPSDQKADDANMVFCAHARTDQPDLLDLVEWQAAEIERLNRQSGLREAISKEWRRLAESRGQQA